MTDALDASAVLAFIAGEPGADLVEMSLSDGAMISAANWSEVAQKVIQTGQDWTLVRALVLAFGVEIVAVDAEDAEWAARRWRQGEGLSLGDRLCLALGHRRASRILTADSACGAGPGIVQIR